MDSNEYSEQVLKDKRPSGTKWIYNDSGKDVHSGCDAG
jgi:hypothetical protein